MIKSAMVMASFFHEEKKRKRKEEHSEFHIPLAFQWKTCLHMQQHHQELIYLSTKWLLAWLLEHG